MSSGIRDLGITFITRVATLLVGLGTQSSLILLLKPAGRGSYAVCVAFSSLLGLVFVIGGGCAPIYHIASKRQSVSDGVINTWVYILLGSLAGMAAGFLLMQAAWCYPHLCPAALKDFFGKADPRDFYLALLMVPVSSLSSTLLMLLPSLGDFAWYGILSVFQAVFQLVLYIVLMWAVDLHVSGAMIATILNSVATIALVMIVMRVRHQLRWVMPSLQKLVEMLWYGLRYYVATISNLVNVQVGALVLAMFPSKMVTESQIGYFVLASTLTNQVMNFPQALNTVMTPRVASSADGRKDLIGQSARVSGIVCGAVLLLMALLAKPAILILSLGHRDFLPAVPLLQILAVGVAIRCAGQSFSSYMTLTDRPGFGSVAVFVGMVVNIGAMVLLLPVMGLSGAAWATTFNYLASSAILYYGFSIFSKTKFWECWRPRRSDFAPLGKVWRKLRGNKPAPLEVSPAPAPDGSAPSPDQTDTGEQSPPPL